MKKLKLFAFILITFLCFGVISVNAKNVSTVDEYKSAIKDSTITEIILTNNLDIRTLSDSNNHDAIDVNRNIVLDLNGYTITTGDISGNSAAIKVFYFGNYTLTIKNSKSHENKGKIHSFCDNTSFGCSISPIVLSFTDECNQIDSNCDAKLILQDITISTSNKYSDSNNTFIYLMNIGTPNNIPQNKSKYNVEISNVSLENEILVKQLFAHNFAYDSTSPILNLNIKSMSVNGIGIGCISKVSGYKVKDILNETRSELLINNTVITDPEMEISNYDISTGFVIREKNIIEYKVTNGDGQKHIIGKEENAVFRIDAEKDLFSKAYLDDEELNSEFYTITEGSTIITLKQEFLNNLLPGTYNLRATFSDGGEAHTTFIIAQPIENNPNTGDSIILSIIFGSISLISLFGVGIYFKKKNVEIKF